MARLEAKARRDLGLARLAAAKQPAGRLQLGPCRPVDGAVDAAAAQKGAVGGIDDRIDIERGDVGFENLDAVGHATLPVARGAGPV
jgi:hypothetical protein